MTHEKVSSRFDYCNSLYGLTLETDPEIPVVSECFSMLPGWVSMWVHITQYSKRVDFAFNELDIKISNPHLTLISPATGVALIL